jgi:hypothetical protein
MQLKQKFNSLCDPAKLYLIITIIAIVFALMGGIKVMAVVMKLIFALIWVFILNWICKEGYTGVSWFLVLLPYILIILAMFKLQSLFR